MYFARGARSRRGIGISFGKLSLGARLRKQLSMMESDSEYFSRRAAQEATAADKAPSAEARSAHFQMAERYRDLAMSIEKNDRRLGVVRALRNLIHR